jgi:outer membrane receptor for monomeric catechols
VVDSFQTVKGWHSIIGGGEFQWEGSNNTSISTGTLLSLSYSNNETAGFAANKATLTTTQGVGYASFLIGSVDAAGITDNRPATTIYGRYRNFSPYVQDDIKVSKSLTVNLGLRWDIFSPWQETQNRFSSVNLNALNPITGTPGALRFGGSGNASTATARLSRITG